MDKYRKSMHCTYDIKYHIVWITMYRKPVLVGKIAERTRELIRGVCQTNDVKILAGHVSKDHIHLLDVIVPQYNGSEIIDKEREKLCDRYYTGAPEQQRQPSEQYKIVKRV